ncbi:hypothetical protein K438DRAFT_1764618 [Mycena galopus ATCC 62051]|nr:hypothetical protein K438DRAFT_1764618 [Mycena galopus ATCC 62051]
MNRNMIINYCPGELTADVTLMLTFTPPSANKLSTEQNVVAWKVIKLKSVPGSKANNTAIVSYSGRLAFGLTQDDIGNVIYGASTVEMSLGDTVDVNWSDDSSMWGLPAKGNDTGTLIKAKNTTQYRQNVSVGTLQNLGGVEVYTPSFLWKVGSTLAVEADFHPMLQAYVNLGYVQNEFITADITGNMITEWNLAALPAVSNWKFTQLPQGNYAINLVKFQTLV